MNNEREKQTQSNPNKLESNRVEGIFFGLAVAGTATQCLPFVALAKKGHSRTSSQCHSRMSLAGIHYLPRRSCPPKPWLRRKYPLSSVENPESSIEHQASSIESLKFAIQHLLFDIRYLLPNSPDSTCISSPIVLYFFLYNAVDEGPMRISRPAGQSVPSVAGCKYGYWWTGG